MFTYFILYFFIISHFLVLFLFFVARSSVLFSSASFSAFLAFLPSIAVTLDLDHDPGELQQPNTVDLVIIKSKSELLFSSRQPVDHAGSGIDDSFRSVLHGGV